MINNLFKNKLFYYSKKLFYFFLDKINDFHTEKYSKFYFLTDGANWATDETTNDILFFFKKNKLNTKICLYPPKKQFVYCSDQYSVFKKNFFSKKNIIALDYQHGLAQYNKNNQKLLNFVRKHQDNIKLIRVTNNFFKSYLIKNGIKKNKIIVIPNTVDTKIFKPLNNKKNLRKRFNLAQNKFLIGSFQKDGQGFGSGLNPKLIKGPDVFAKTLKDLQKYLGKNKICVVLTSPARGYLKKKLDTYKIEYSHFHPFDKKQLPCLYNCLDIYLIASRDEGGPRGMFEAMACGVPVVSTTIGHAHDYIINNYNGFKSPINNNKLLTKNIIKIYKNKKLKSKIIKNSLLTAKKNNFLNHRTKWKIFIKKFQLNTN